MAAPVRRYENNPILTKADVPYEVETVHNAGVVKHQGRYVMLFRSHLRSGRSIIGLAESDDGLAFRVRDRPFLTPATDGAFAEYEAFGVEDPRITCIGDTYWFTYVAVSRHGPATALASTTDFQTLTRHGVIFPIENKDVVLLPEAIDGEYVALHRPVGGTPFTQPEMWLARSSRKSPEPPESAVVK